jgi:DNA-binding NarL/FixJ family response regulator
VKCILIADDSALIRQGLRRMFEVRGWRVCAEAANGREAIMHAQEFKPDIVVLDLAMPVMNGLDAGLAIKELLPTAHLILFTSHGHILGQEQVASFGFSALVSKNAGESIVAKAQSLLDTASRGSEMS